jgi:hypothetical protein
MIVFIVEVTDEEWEFLLPEWFPYLEYVLLSFASLIGLMALGCVCLNCCPVFCGKNDDDDDEEDNLQTYRGDSTSVYPLDRLEPFSRRTGMEY